MTQRKIKLGDTEFTITVPLTLGQLIEANVGMATPAANDPQEETRRGYRRTLDVLVSAIKPDHPDVTVDTLMALRGVTMSELNAAALAAFEESGLISRKETPPAGEVTAEAA